MNIWKTKRICSVRGCRNMTTYHMSRNRQAGNSINICESCLAEGLKAVRSLPEGERALVENNVTNTSAPSLFFHPSTIKVAEPLEEVKVTEEEVTENAEIEEDADVQGTEAEEPAEDAQTEEDAEPEGFVCPKCGKVYKSQSAFNRHILTCDGGDK